MWCMHVFTRRAGWKYHVWGLSMVSSARKACAFAIYLVRVLSKCAATLRYFEPSLKKIETNRNEIETKLVDLKPFQSTSLWWGKTNTHDPTWSVLAFRKTTGNSMISCLNFLQLQEAEKPKCMTIVWLSPSGPSCKNPVEKTKKHSSFGEFVSWVPGLSVVRCSQVHSKSTTA